jgi:hypothetical protein
LVELLLHLSRKVNIREKYLSKDNSQMYYTFRRQFCAQSVFYFNVQFYSKSEIIFWKSTKFTFKSKRKFSLTIFFEETLFHHYSSPLLHMTIISDTTDIKCFNQFLFINFYPLIFIFLLFATNCSCVGKKI